MKILFIVPYPPSLIRVRPYNLIRFLAQRGHHITVCTLYANEAEKNDVRHLEDFCQAVITAPMPKWQSFTNSLIALPSSTPLQAVYSWKKRFAEQILNLCKSSNGSANFDVIHVEHLRGSKYGLFLQNALMQSPIPIVWDSVDCISLLFRLALSGNMNVVKRLITQLELQRSESYERDLIGTFSQVCITSKIDQQALETLPRSGSKRAEINILPNGVDLEYFSVGTFDQRKENTLVVSGKMSYHANINMVLHLTKNIMPLIWEQNPSVKLQIVGKDPVKEILVLAENPAIVVTGAVNDIRPFLQQATIALTPIIYGVGIQNKVLEAMACGTPIVSTSQAVTALDVHIGKDILVADDPIEYANHVNELLQNQQHQFQIGAAGRAYVETNHNWLDIAGKLEQIYLRAES